MKIGLISFAKEYTTCKNVTHSVHSLYCCSILLRTYALYRVGQQYFTEFEERKREKPMEGNVYYIKTPDSTEN